MKKRLLASALCLILLLGLAGCTGGANSSVSAPDSPKPVLSDPAPTPAPDPVISAAPSEPVADPTVSPVDAPVETPAETDAPVRPSAAPLQPSGTPAPAVTSPEEAKEAFVDAVDVEIEAVELAAEAVALAQAPTPALPVSILSPVASGTAVKSTTKATLDYSNIGDGYVMAQYTGQTDKRIKAIVKGPTGSQYQYNLTAGKWAVFPLSDGSGAYQVAIYEQVQDSKYAAVVAADFTAILSDEFAPFLRPNQYVDYSAAPNTVAKAVELMAGLTTPLEKVNAVYTYVVTTLSYDKDRASNVKSGYLPVLDTVLSEKKGICFDYAALMTGMLRSQGVPCKLVVGYAGQAYHAWISVWSAETGWVDGAIYFDGLSWQRMDPTFASNAGQSEAIMKYIGDGQNYTAKYLY